jgi:hypothetical protein
MGDYISRDMAIARLTKVEVTNRLATMTDAKRVIAEMPAADVAPVVHGRETREGGSTMISEAIDRAVKAKWRADLVNMLTDAGRTLAGTGLRANGSVYRDINIGLLLLEAARSLQECQDKPEPEKPDDVVVKVTVPDRWPMTEAGQRWAAQEAAASKPMTNGDRIRSMTDEELARSKFGEAICNLIPYEFCRVSDIECNVCKAKWLGSPAKAAAPKPMTNGDRLRAMTDAELARSRFGDNLCELIPYEFCQGSDIGCDVCKAKWLGSPAKEAAPEPVTNGDRIQDRKDEELAARERLERLYEETRQIADRRAWDETSRTMADSCGQEAKDGQ